jgi:PAS domain S-box-containing protein
MKKNGEYAHINASGTTVRDEEGNPVRSAGTLIDITPMKNLVDEAELQMTKLNVAMQAGKVMMWEMEVVKDDVANPENKVNWPDEFRHLLGFENEQEFPNTIGSLFSRIHPEDLERVSKAAVSHTLDKTGQTPYNVEYRLEKKQGGYVHIHATGETVRDEDGNPLRTAGTIIDITQTRNLVNTLENVLNNIDEYIYVTDRNTDEILFINDAMRQHYGIESDGVGQICYKVFQDGFNERCEFCPCYKLDKDPDTTVVWQEHSTVTNRTYRNTDRYIKWINGYGRTGAEFGRNAEDA